MALTSPDNIWTPDSSDNYALTTDLAATADSIQDAITKKANYGVGTTAEMNAAVNQFPNGATWYNTTNDTEYRRVSGAWVSLAPYRRSPASISISGAGLIGGVAYIASDETATYIFGISIQPGTLSNGAVVGSFNTSIFPTNSVDSQVNIPLVANSNSGHGWLNVQSNGSLRLYHYQITSNEYLRGSGSWPTF